MEAHFCCGQKCDSIVFSIVVVGKEWVGDWVMMVWYCGGEMMGVGGAVVMSLRRCY